MTPCQARANLMMVADSLHELQVILKHTGDRLEDEFPPGWEIDIEDDSKPIHPTVSLSGCALNIADELGQRSRELEREAAG